ncbi:aspartate racemase [Hanseniaspora valbyensis NRRL Y-1626]|uniref:Aspartate racemase n=1 Tax=Hanseniaspora valbyensis NRRL Y-1626 TaxID=766949 RepID=A0A1B7TAR8_9ASCO|nr:aspartate racemase [Hanseniaspora valbyensis NRRL Y-1626]
MAVTFGVLAGMGVLTTAPFVDMLISSCQKLYGAKHDKDYPEMHIISLPAPFNLEGKSNDDLVIETLVRGIKNLVKVEVNFIVVPCNTAHCYYKEMKEAANGIPILHIADVSVMNFKKDNKNVAILATEYTLNAGFYQQKLIQSGKNVIESKFLRETTTELILTIKSRGFEDIVVKKLWEKIISWAIEFKVDALLIGCTDISPLIKNEKYPFDIVDTAKSLANAAILEYIKFKKN